MHTLVYIRTVHILELDYPREGLAQTNTCPKDQRSPLYIITLGVMRTIYKDALTAMEALSISPSAR